MDANHWNPFHTEFCLLHCVTQKRLREMPWCKWSKCKNPSWHYDNTRVNAERVSSLSHQGTIGVLWPQEWSWQDNINGRDHREMPLPKNSESSSGWWRNSCCGSEPTLINNQILITNFVEWDCVQITLKSRHRCASLPCITWISCTTWLSLIIIDYHWLSWIIIDYHWLSFVYWIIE